MNDIHILFVDDEPDILKAFERLMARQNYATHFAGSGAEALDVMAATPIHIVITDMKMPVMDGLSFLRHVKVRYPDTVRLALSAYLQVDQLLHCINTGEIFRFIIKPTTPEELKRAIQDAVDYFLVRKDRMSLVHELLDNNQKLQQVLEQEKQVKQQLRSKQIEQEVQNEKLRAMQVELMSSKSLYHDGIIHIDMQGRIQNANASLIALLGYSLEEIKLLTHRQLTPLKWHDMEDEIVRTQVIPQGYSREYEKEYVRKDGSVFPVSLRVWSIMDEQGNPSGMWAIIKDITRYRNIDEELANHRWRLESIIEGTHVGTWEWNIQTGETVFNEVWAEMIGYTLDELSPTCITTWESLAHPDDLKASAAIIERHFAGELPYYKCECRIKHKDGHWVWVLDRGRIITRTADGRPLMMFGTHTDISDRKRTEEALQKAHAELEQRVQERTASLQAANESLKQEMMERKRAEEEKCRLEAQFLQAQKMESIGRLAGGVAHDFNNMLGIILGHAELALDQVDPSQHLYADLEEIRTTANRSADLTRQLLAFARKQTIIPRVVYLNEIMEGMLKMLRRLIGEDIDLLLLPGSDLWQVKVDPSQIDQILVNLCVNGRDAISGVGKITIATGNGILNEAFCATHPGAAPGEFVKLTVSDTGFGMDKETIHKIFEPFFTTKEMGKGTGLGLATVYGIVKQNNGFIDVCSEPEQGTAITIYLPRHVDLSEKAQKTRSEETAAPGHETILLVEDEQVILNMTQIMLERQGYTVLAANTPSEAIRMAKAFSGEIHLLMTDVVMPEMNGRDLADELMKLHPNLICLYISGYTADIIARHGVLDPGVNFIQKPFSMKTLLSRVSESLAEATKKETLIK